MIDQSRRSRKTKVPTVQMMDYSIEALIRCPIVHTRNNNHIICGPHMFLEVLWPHWVPDPLGPTGARTYHQVLGNKQFCASNIRFLICLTIKIEAE